MLERAVRICDAAFGNIYRWDGEALQHVAGYKTPPAFAEARRRFRWLPPASKSPVGQMVESKVVVHITDAAQEQAYLDRSDPGAVDAVELGGVRTLLFVPMLKEGELVGAFAVSRREVRRFTDKQIALVANFAAQAVIAIENARLLNELRQRTADLTEALDQQVATSELLQVISSSPGDLERIFATMLENAVRICDATFGDIFRWEDATLRLVASYKTPAAFAEMLRRSPVISPGHGSFTRRMLETKTRVHIADLSVDPLYLERKSAQIGAAVDLGGVRTVLAVPMLREGELIGEFMLNREQVCPFTEKQIELVENFAAQAVIAIENARLLNELRQRTTDLTERTADLTEALEQQTATSEVLQVISGSPGDLQPVFSAMLENAVRICDAKLGNIYRWDGDALHLAASHNTPAAYAEHRRHTPLRFNHMPESLRRMVGTRGPIQVEDILALSDDAEKRNPVVVAGAELGGIRTVLNVPMLKENDLVGAFIVSRQEVRPFTDKQIELVKNFAAQAVIAIENARLLKELRERTTEVEKLNQHLEQRVTDQVGEIERMSRLRRFLPPQVADLIVASGSDKQLESHRREITALFCDLRGFTGFTESADAEDVMALLREYHAAIGEKIIKYSGTLERYAGDGVMVVFNDPVPVDNPALQAVLMALEMRDAIGALTETWRRWGHEIGFGIGIAHGFATLGTIGFEGRFDYAAIGTVSNVASRLCDEAKPGQILINPRVLTKVENAVKVEPVGEFELKGIRRPLAAYNVLCAAS
jgi:GAF domain-containing protein